MSAITEVSGLCNLRNGEVEAITAIQDHFGVAYRCLPEPAPLGARYYTNYHRSRTYAKRKGSPELGLACTIIRRARLNTVKAMWRRLGTDIPLRKGFWYEVRGE